MPEPFVRSKFHVPPTRRELIKRSRLIDRLNAGLDARLTLVCAPAGSGKTTLLSDWSRQCGARVTWISLDKSDNDPYRFIGLLGAGLRSFERDAESAALTVTLPAAPMLSSPYESPGMRQDHVQSLELVLAGLINEISAAWPAPQVLILDDYHLIEADAIHQALSFLIERLPVSIHVVIATRFDPPLPLARLRARGQICELRGQNLRFTREEAGAFLKKLLGTDLSNEDLDILEERTEGWAAGLQLAALIIQGNPDVHDLIKNLSGSNRYIFDYLAQEVLSHQPDDIQTFLLKTSILEVMNAGLCRAVTGREDSQAILERLEQNNLFILPLDDERTWFRYHHLFIDLLRFRLGRSAGTPGNMPPVGELHIRASEWCAAHNMVYEAIGHALYAEDYERARDLMEQAGPNVTLRGEIKTLGAWLTKLPERLVRTSPRLSTISAWALLLALDIDYMEARLNDAMRALRVPKDLLANWPADIAPANEAVVGDIVSLNILVAAFRGNVAYAIRLAEEGLRRVRADDVGTRGVLSEILGDVYRDAGDVPRALAAYTQSYDYYRAEGNELGILLALDGIAWMKMQRGDLAEAEQLFRQVIRLPGSSEHIQPSLAVAKSHVGLGLLLRERNELAAAERQLLQGVAECELGGYVRHLLTALAGLAQLKASQGKFAEALLIVDRAVRAAGGVSLDGVLAGVLAHRAVLQLHLRAGGLAAAERWSSSCGLHLDDSPTYGRQGEYLALARVALATSRRSVDRDRLLRLAALLQQLFEAANAFGRRNDAIAILLLLAEVLEEAGCSQPADAALQQAVQLGCQERYQRVFLDEGSQVKGLLQRNKDAGLIISAGCSTYVEELLAHLEGGAPADQGGTLLVDPLTERELEVLRLVARGKSNREICAELYISMGTANTHIRHILEKLGAHSRTQAAALAREMHLIE